MSSLELHNQNRCGGTGLGRTATTVQSHPPATSNTSELTLTEVGGRLCSQSMGLDAATIYVSGHQLGHFDQKLVEVGALVTGTISTLPSVIVIVPGQVSTAAITFDFPHSALACVCLQTYHPNESLEVSS